MSPSKILLPFAVIAFFFAGLIAAQALSTWAACALAVALMATGIYLRRRHGPR